MTNDGRARFGAVHWRDGRSEVVYGSEMESVIGDVETIARAVAATRLRRGTFFLAAVIFVYAAATILLSLLIVTPAPVLPNG
ncbi:MAG TPA: hypothetical protein VFP72_05800 [Kineosporiaceae bacterium]|nr:hypothetical protein [Kineosporiaceae bacterium]